MLRGPQTAGELKTRTTRLHELDDVASVLATLEERELVHRLPRQPGRREERWTHQLGEETGRELAAATVEAPSSFERRLADLEARVAGLERLLEAREPYE
jgi:uncharacterized protein